MTIGNDQGSRDVAIQDQTTAIIDLHLTKFIDDATILLQTAIDDVVIRIQVLTTPLVGDLLCLKETAGEAFYQGAIVSVTPVLGDDYDVGLDTPLDFPFSVLDDATLDTDNLAVNGAIAPVTFRVSAEGLADNVEWDVVRTMASVIGTSVMDDGLFGDLPALTKGIVIRTSNGIEKNIFNAKTNGDVKLHAFDLRYSERAPAGQTGMSFRRTFGGQDKNGVVARIVANLGDGFDCIVQDDLTGLTNFTMVVQGHIVERG